MKRARGSPGKKHEEKLLALLCDGLSEVELGRVMAGALLVMDAPAIDILVKLLGPDTGATLQSILAAARDDHAPVKTERRVGGAKILQEWKQAWREWDECVSESCDEEGRYKYQEHHWEEPFLDTSTLADDLDRVAGDLQPLAERVQAGGLDPEFSLADKLRQTVEDIGCGLPDYMDPWRNEGFNFGKEATLALLEWECRASRTKDEPMSEAVRRVVELTVQTEHLDLDGGAIVRFIRELPKEERQVVTNDLRDHQASEPWKSALKGGWGTWNSVVKVLAGKGKLTKAGRIILPVGRGR